MTMDSDTNATRPTVIDLDADQVVEEATRSTAAAPDQSTPAAKPSVRSRLLPVAAAALVLGGIGGGWLYRDVLANYFPSDEMTALRQRVTMLGKVNEELATKLQALERISTQLTTDFNALETSSNAVRAAAEGTTEQLQAEAARIAALETQGAEVAASLKVLKSQPMTTTDGVTIQLPPDLAARIETLEKDVASLKTQEPDRANVTALAQALSDLKAKIESGVGFADEQARIVRMVPAAAGLDILSLHAAEGLPHAKGLAGELAALAPSLPRPDTTPAPVAEPGLWDSILESLSTIITIRDLDAVDWQVIAAKAGALAESNDLAEAISIIDAVEDTRPAALQQWRDRAAARIALEAALATVSESVQRDIAARP